MFITAMVLVPIVQPDGLHSVYTRTPVLFHKGELVLLSGDAEMLLRRPGINRRVFREGIIIGDLNRSFSSLIDSSSEVGPGRPFPGRLPSILTLRRGGRDGIQGRRRNWFLICFTAGREMKRGLWHWHVCSQHQEHITIIRVVTLVSPLSNMVAAAAAAEYAGANGKVTTQGLFAGSGE